MSTKNDEFGLASPVLSLRAGPSSGCSQSDTRSVSLPPTSSVFPSGIHSARAMPRSIGCPMERTA